jgi:hypothetical protein
MTAQDILKEFEGWGIPGTLSDDGTLIKIGIGATRVHCYPEGTAQVKRGLIAYPLRTSPDELADDVLDAMGM